MKEDIPLLSIVIPTRNRFQYVIYAIKNILSIQDKDFELLIHDSSDTKELESYILKNIFDSRLHYYYSDPPLTFSETFNKSVLLSSGEYVCIIGDDDGVNPEIIQATRWAKEQNIDALTPILSAFYGWPDFQLRYYKNSEAGRLKIKGFSGRIYYPDVEAEMLKSARNAFQDFGGLPKIYYGIIKMSCLEEVYSFTGAFFFGSSPDISGAVAVSNYVKRLCIIDYPLFVPGSSSNSGSGRSAMKKHVGKLEDETQTKPYSKTWPNLVPKFYSVQTVWAQAGLAALSATKRQDLIEVYNVPLLHAMCIVYNPTFYKIILSNLFRSINSKPYDLLKGILLFIVFALFAVSKRIKSHLLRFARLHNVEYDHDVCGINNIEEAVLELSKHLVSSGKSFRNTVS